MIFAFVCFKAVSHSSYIEDCADADDWVAWANNNQFCIQNCIYNFWRGFALLAPANSTPKTSSLACRLTMYSSKCIVPSSSSYSRFKLVVCHGQNVNFKS